MRISTKTLTKSQIKSLPEWVTDDDRNNTVGHRFEFYLYNVIAHYSRSQINDAIKSYESNKKKNPDWEEAFETEYVTNGLIELRYNKSPNDLLKNKKLSYRQFVNAMLYKAYDEHKDTKVQYALDYAKSCVKDFILNLSTLERS